MGRKVTLKAGWSFWAKAVANTLNAKPIGKLVMNLVGVCKFVSKLYHFAKGGKKRFYYHDDLWNIKYSSI